MGYTRTAAPTSSQGVRGWAQACLRQQFKLSPKMRVNIVTPPKQHRNLTMHLVSAWGGGEGGSQLSRLHVWRLVCRPMFLTRTPEFPRPHRRSSDRFAQEATATSSPQARIWLSIHRMRPGGKISRNQGALVYQCRDYGTAAQLLQASSGCNPSATTPEPTRRSSTAIGQPGLDLGIDAYRHELNDCFEHKHRRECVGS